MDDHANGLTSFPTSTSQAVADLGPTSANGANASTPVVAIPTVLVAVEGGPPQKKRRGRPPKSQTPPNGIDGAAAAEAPKSTRRGRPPGSRNKVSRATTGVQPHVLLVNSGEDIVEKLKSFSMTYKRSLCVLAASGALSSATLMQVGQGGHGVGVTLAGQFTVLSISGAVLHEHGDPATGDPKVFLSASLANPTGGVVGGTVAGPMETNGSAMVVVGHWAPDSVRSSANGVDTQTPASTTLESRQSLSATASAPAASTPAQSSQNIPTGGTPVQVLPALSPQHPMPAFPTPLANFPNPPIMIPSASGPESGQVETKQSQTAGAVVGISLDPAANASIGGGLPVVSQPGMLSPMVKLPSTGSLLGVPQIPVVQSTPVNSMMTEGSVTTISANPITPSEPSQTPISIGQMPIGSSLSIGQSGMPVMVASAEKDMSTQETSAQKEDSEMQDRK